MQKLHPNTLLTTLKSSCKSALLIPLLLLQLFSFNVHSASIPAESNQLRVITSGGFATAYKILAPQFEQKTGIKLNIYYGSSSGGAPDSIPVRIDNGQPFDVIILSKTSLNNLTKLGHVLPESRVDLVRSIIGMAIKEGATAPDISTNDAFINTLLNAQSIGYSASASGTYLSTVLWPKINVWEKIAHKSKRILSERVATVVARGDVEIGFQQISEILPIKGATFTSPIPTDFQKVTTFSTGIIKNSPQRTNAQRLIDYLASVGVAKQISDTGLSPVVLEQKDKR